MTDESGKPTQGWLALSRRVGQSLVVTTPDGQQVWLLVTAIRRDGSVRIGVHAPPEYKILREEIYEGKS